MRYSVFKMEKTLKAQLIKQLVLGLATQNCGRLIAEKNDQSSMGNRFLTFSFPGYINREKDQFCFRSLVYTDIDIVNFRPKYQQMKKFVKSHQKSSFHNKNIKNRKNLLQMNVFTVLPWRVLKIDA